MTTNSKRLVNEYQSSCFSGISLYLGNASNGQDVFSYVYILKNWNVLALVVGSSWMMRHALKQIRFIQQNMSVVTMWGRANPGV